MGWIINGFIDAHTLVLTGPAMPTNPFFCLRLGILLRQGGTVFPQGFPGQMERMGIMDQAIQDRIRQGRMAQGFMPVGDWRGRHKTEIYALQGVQRATPGAKGLLGQCLQRATDYLRKQGIVPGPMDLVHLSPLG